jgi:phage terminase Nu1 subunit (DNA packaging protein)
MVNRGMLPELISTRDLARLLDTTPKTVAAWAQDGVIERASQGKYPLVASVHAVLRRQRQRAGSTVAGQVGSQRARLLKLQADRVELQIKVESGELVELAMVVATVNVMPRGIRSQFLALPARLGARLSLSREGVSVAHDEVCDIMNDCAHVLRWEVPDSLVDAARRAIEAEVGKEGDGEPKRRRA